MQGVNYEEIVKASNLLREVVHKTPVLTSTTIDAKTNNNVFFKCENFQRIGAFKIRGAFNAMFRYKKEGDLRGVITYSSGNHAQAIALAGKILDVATTVIMPEDAPSVKIEATRGYGANVVLYDRFEVVREELGEKMAKEKGLRLIPPYDHEWIVAGQGTVAKEFLEEVGELDFLLVPCGGGGLLSGCAIATKKLCPSCKVIGVEPELADDATKSFYSKVLHSVHNPNTIADGARTASLGKVTFPLVLEHVDEMVTVSEEAITNSMFYLWERMKIIVEPTGALAFAALYDNKFKFASKRVGIIVSGGNVNLNDFIQTKK